MLGRSVCLLTLLAVSFAEFYPLHELAVRDPRSFDLLYSTTSGPHSETWNFASPVKITAVIIPSQVFNFNSGGLWPGGTYSEAVEVQVFQTQLANDAADEVTTLVGSGSFNGSAYFGRELRIPVRAEGDAAVQVQEFVSDINGFSYTFNIVFGSTGFYPWYTSRGLTAYSSVDDTTGGAGIALGIAFSNS